MDYKHDLLFLCSTSLKIKVFIMWSHYLIIMLLIVLDKDGGIIIDCSLFWPLYIVVTSSWLGTRIYTSPNIATFWKKREYWVKCATTVSIIILCFFASIIRSNNFFFYLVPFKEVHRKLWNHKRKKYKT